MIIYCSTNILNNKKYVGQTSGTIGEGLLKRHLSKTSYFASALKKYGTDNFKWEIIDNANSRKELNEREIFWIDKLKTLHPGGYNLHVGGNASSGWKSNSISILARSIAQKGMRKKPCSEERKLKISESKRNKNYYILIDLNIFHSGILGLIIDSLKKNGPLNISELTNELKLKNPDKKEYDLRRSITYRVNKLHKEGRVAISKHFCL